MKGIVFNLLQEAVTREHGEDTWDALLDGAGLDGAYTALGTYPDGDVVRLLTVAAETLGTTPDAVLRWFGRSALPLLAQAYPKFFEAHASTHPFVLSLNDIIHPEVRKLYPGADVPTFDFESRADGSLAIGYLSGRKLCSFAEGLIEGAAAHFGETVTITQSQCMLRGDDRCVLVCSFSKAA
jgi:hypothetical protein